MKPKLSIEQLEAQAELIALVNDGKLTPRAAEQRALELGCAPLTSKPEPHECDPQQRAQWTLIMAVGWIAWRDLSLVRESSPEYAKATTQWRGERLNLPSPTGGIQKREVWSIAQLRPRTNAWLRDLEINMRAHGQLPKLSIPISDAWVCLRQACERGDLIAKAIDEDGHPVEMTPAHWQGLKPFEEREKPVLKRNALDTHPAYTEVSFRNSDVLNCWLPRSSFAAIDVDELFVDEPAYALVGIGDEEFVPLSSAIYWIATKRGVHQIKFGDAVAWQTSAKLITNRIQSDAIELIGRSRDKNEIIPGHRLAGIPIRSPVDIDPAHIAISAQSHISCSVFTSHIDWPHTGGDRFYRANSISPTYTHLQVRNSHVLNSFPQPSAKDGDLQTVKNWLIAEMRASPQRRPKNKSDYRTEAGTKFGVAIGARPFNNIWREAVEEASAPAWVKHGPTKSSVQYTNRVRNAGLKKR